MQRLQFTNKEQTALLMFDKLNALHLLERHAAELVQVWYRIRRDRKMNTRKREGARRVHLQQIKDDFKKKKKVARQEMEDCFSDQAKIDQIHDRLKALCSSLEERMQKSSPHDTLKRQGSLNGSVVSSGSRMSGDPRPPPPPPPPAELSMLPSLAPRDWRRSPVKVDEQVTRSSRLALLFASLGTLFALLQNEMIFAEEDPHDNKINALKFANLCCSVLCVVSQVLPASSRSRSLLSAALCSYPVLSLPSVVSSISPPSR
eukprot:767143-Hanusia_phi.AAC.3